MTEIEAIKKHIKECTKRIGNIQSFVKRKNYNDDKKCEDNIFTLKTAISALEKQIPKKLIKRKATDKDVESELRDFITPNGKILRCPNCRSYICINDTAYCLDCGQKLDWGD